MQQKIHKLKNARSVVKIGNGLGIILPMEFTKAAGLTEDESVEMWTDGSELLIKPVHKPADIRELFEGYDGNYKGEEIDWGTDLGGETI